VSRLSYFGCDLSFGLYHNKRDPKILVEYYNTRTGNVVFSVCCVDFVPVKVEIVTVSEHLKIKAIVCVFFRRGLSLQ
jgi:hypothetical protein